MAEKRVDYDEYNNSGRRLKKHYKRQNSDTNADAIRDVKIAQVGKIIDILRVKNIRIRHGRN